MNSSRLVIIAAQVRLAIKIIIALIVLYIIALFISPTVKNTYYALFPPKDQPTIKWGKLEPLEFVEKRIRGNPTFKLNTQNGKLPNNFPKKLPVYVTIPQPFSYTAGRDAQKHAAYLGFSEDELTSNLKTDVFSWRDRETQSVLVINTKTKELELSTNFSNKTGLFDKGLVNENEASSRAKKILSDIGRLRGDTYKDIVTTVTLGKIQDGRIVKAEKQFEAELASVNIYRNINGYMILGPDPFRSNIHLILGRQHSRATPLNHPVISFTETTISPDTTGTYPLIPISEAWKAVSSENKGILAGVLPLNSDVFTEYEPTNVTQVFIDHISIAYYETPKKQKFLQPIYVFRGTFNVNNRPGGTIYYYYPAIPGQYIMRPTTNTQ